MPSTAGAFVRHNTLSNASRYGSIQRAFNDRLREWHWQRNSGTKYQVWNPPGVLFSRLLKDHWEPGSKHPPFSDWAFPEVDDFAAPRPKPALRLVVRALAGRWVVSQARQRPDEQFVVVDGNDAHIFRLFFRAVVAFGIEAEEPTESFPNLRLLYANERTAATYLEPGSVRSVHVHLPWLLRETRPRREALITARFLAGMSDLLEESGELHIITDDEAIAKEASSVLTQSRIFAPCLGFPFHESDLPLSYPAGDSLRADIAESLEEAGAKRPLLYMRWEKRLPRLPNFRFRQGRGYGAMVIGIPP